MPIPYKCGRVKTDRKVHIEHARHAIAEAGPCIAASVGGEGNPGLMRAMGALARFSTKHGFTAAEEQELAREWNATCIPPWDSNEWHQVERALEKCKSEAAQGQSCPSDKQSSIASQAVLLPPMKSLLTEGPPVALPDVLQQGFETLLRAAFEKGERVSIAPLFPNKTTGKATPKDSGTVRTREEWLELSSKEGGIQKHLPSAVGAWIRVNPVQVGTGTDADVSAYRHVLVEFDGDSNGDPIPKDVQHGWLERSGLPITAIIDSGNKSIHAWVRVDAKDREEYDARVAEVFALFHFTALDKKNRNPGRFSRCPEFKRMDSEAVSFQNLHAVHVGAESWEAFQKPATKPRPLPTSKQHPVPPFDFAMLPPKFRAFVADVADRMQASPDYTAAALLVGYGSVVGRKASIQPKEHDTGWTEHPHLWGCAVGHSGSMKSPAINSVMSILHKMENAERVKFRDASEKVKAHNEKMKAQQKVHDRAQDKEELRAKLAGETFEREEGDFALKALPPQRRFLISDTNPEALGMTMQDNPKGSLLFQDELPGLLGLMQKDNNQTLRPLLLQAYTGKESYTYDRVGRGQDIFVPSIALGIFGGIQPGALAPHVMGAVSDGKEADGFLQRFSMMVYPDTQRIDHLVDRLPDHAAIQAVKGAFVAAENITSKSVYPYAMEDEEGIPVFKFSTDAQRAFNGWLLGWIQRLQAEDMVEALRSHLTKYRKLVPALALLFHLSEGGRGDVSLEALELAFAWAKYLEEHAKRVYLSGEPRVITGAKKLLRELQKKPSSLPRPFTASQVREKDWAALKGPEDAKAACAVLVEYGWLSARPSGQQPKGGQPTTFYELKAA